MADGSHHSRGSSCVVSGVSSLTVATGGEFDPSTTHGSCAATDAVANGSTLTEPLTQAYTVPMRIQPAYDQLTPSERMFVDQVVQHFDRAATRMNERITMALSRDLPHEIVERSHGMLDRALVQAAIETRVRQIATETEFTPERTLRELGQIAFSNIDDFLYDGAMDVSRATRSQWAAVKKIKYKGGTLDDTLLGAGKQPEIEIEFYNKLDALKMFMAYQGMLQEDNPHWRAQTAPVALPAGATAADAAGAYQALLDG